MISSIFALLFKVIDRLLLWPEKSNRFLETCFAPVSDEVTGECEVKGTIPEALHGLFARVGPNPRFAPRGGYHWFDGDGMMHAVRLKDGKATFSNRYVRTAKLEREEKAGGPIFDNIGETFGMGGLPRCIMSLLKRLVGYVSSRDASRANTALVYYNGQVNALWEAAAPYAVRVLCDGIMETIGEITFGGKIKTPFTAHPKIDPATGKLHALGYQMDTKPYGLYYVLDAEGNVERQLPLPLEEPRLMHDFAITETHAVFMDLPLTIKPEHLLKGGGLLAFDKNKKARFGVLPLDAVDGSSLRWFDMPKPFYAFHALNAWNEGSTSGVYGTPDKIKVVTCDVLDYDFSTTVPESNDQVAKPYTTTLDFITGEVSRDMVIPPAATGAGQVRSIDFPQIRQSLTGRRFRYGYFIMHDPLFEPVAVIKIDYQAAGTEGVVVGRINFGEGKVGGECPFIPAHPDGSGDEDDGYLATFVGQRDGSGTSELRVWNAKTMDPTPLAVIKLPQRVPLGFHAIFLSEEDIAKQKTSQ